MAKEKNIRYPEWIQKAVARFADINKIPSVSKAFIFLLECELNRRGYFRETYEPNIIDHAMHNDMRNYHESPSEREKKLAFELGKKERENERLMNKIKEAGIPEEPHSVIAGMGRYENTKKTG
ncbi:MAG: hypothetical protein FWC97_00520 [Treponema sp.]|nr:hypothetical protein [Treponema sp.]